MTPKYITIHEKNNHQVLPIDERLILKYYSRDSDTYDEIGNYFTKKDTCFEFSDPPELGTIKLSLSFSPSTPEEYNTSPEIYIYLFGARDEILMHSFTFFNKYKVDELKFLRSVWDELRKNNHEVYITHFGFVSKDVPLQINFRCEVEAIELK